MAHLPAPYKNFVEAYPQLAEAHEQLAEVCQQAGPLDEKSCRLVKLGIAIGQLSKGAVKSHASRALAEGSSPDELRHAALLAMTTAGFPTTIAVREWIEAVIAGG